MNRHIIIGNLTRDPVSGTTPTGVNYCKFSVAVNRGKDKPADYMRVTAWRGLAETCQKYLAKGRKVCVIGSSTAYAWQSNEGEIRGEIQIDAVDVEFLSSRADEAAQADGGGTSGGQVADPSGMTQVETDELPF